MSTYLTEIDQMTEREHHYSEQDVRIEIQSVTIYGRKKFS
jgi:hypothetical protein